MAVALYVRVSTNRQPQAQTIAHQLERLHTSMAAHPEWHLAEEHIYRDDGYSAAKLNGPGLDRIRDRAATAACERILMTAPDRWPATISITCSSLTNSPNAAVRSSVWTAR